MTAASSRAPSLACPAETLPAGIRLFTKFFAIREDSGLKAWLQTILKAAHIWNDGRVESGSETEVGLSAGMPARHLCSYVVHF